MELNSIWRPMRTLQHAEFVALLAAVKVSQAGFALLAGVSCRAPVNRWCRGRVALPRWAALLAAAAAVQELSAETPAIKLEEHVTGLAQSASPSPPPSQV
jgi:DNA-binding transcriptional regulator YiaG